MKYLVLSLALIISGCASFQAQFDEIPVGASKGDVISTVGSPENAFKEGETEYFLYTHSQENRWLVLENGKVVAAMTVPQAKNPAFQLQQVKQAMSNYKDGQELDLYYSKTPLEMCAYEKKGQPISKRYSSMDECKSDRAKLKEGYWNDKNKLAEMVREDSIRDTEFRRNVLLNVVANPNFQPGYKAIPIQPVQMQQIQTQQLSLPTQTNCRTNRIGNQNYTNCTTN